MAAVGIPAGLKRSFGAKVVEVRPAMVRRHRVGRRVLAHQIELSLSGHQFAPPVSAQLTGMAGWAAVAESAAEQCLVIDTNLTIVAASPSCCTLLGMGDPNEIVGRPLLKVLRLIDFTANRNLLTDSDIDKIPPLLAVTSGRLARG